VNGYAEAAEAFAARCCDATYASAATAAVSERALAAAAEEILLDTDLANPVSNSIYQRIGYRPVEDRAVLLFSPGTNRAKG